ncbi:MAG: GIY-YIG nuclease family protein [Thermoleophilia bacterium]|nr:GIY-YIG nuclease family protein [Thermoleophilia bacterium]
MQLALDATDRLVDLLEERGRPLSAVEAARHLFAARAVPQALAHSLLADVAAGDARLRLVGSAVALAGAERDPPLEEVEFVIFDVETTGLSAATSRLCEIGAVRVRGFELVDRFQTLVDPGMPLPAEIGRLTGLRDAELRRAPSAATAVRRLARFAGDAVLVAHNARFDQAFIERQLDLLWGKRLAVPPLDTVALARRLLEGRVGRVGLASLVHFFGTPTQPCHRALPDAEATAEVLVRLLGLAQERGARTLADLVALSAPRERRVYGKRSLAHGAPPRPGVYLFRDRAGEVLYVGRARDLRARLRSYFRSERQRPSVEAALAAVEEIEWRVLGSEVEAALEELRLIRELTPPANARGRGARAVYLRRRGDGLIVTETPGRLGPLGNRRQAATAARALERAGVVPFDGSDGVSLAAMSAAVEHLRARLLELSECLRYEEAARLRDKIEALEQVLARVRRLERLRAARLCLVAPAASPPGAARAIFVAGGRVAAVRTLPPGGGAALEIEAGLAAARAAAAGEPSVAAEDAEDLSALAPFLRRPPPELRVVPLRRDTVEAAAATLSGLALRAT